MTELMLKLLSLVIVVYSVVALIVASRAIAKARRDAYEIMHEDFIDLKRRVKRELNKDKSDE